MNGTVLALGTILEVLGAAMVAAPEVAPLVTKATRALLASRFVAYLTRLIRGPRHIVVSVEPGTIRFKAGRISARTSVGDDASNERKVAWLLDQAREAQDRLDEIERNLADEPERREEELAELRREFETYVTSELRRESELYLTLRRLGVVLVIVGVILVSIGS